jgi:hypothetical protein
MINADEIRLTEIEATKAAYEDPKDRWINPMDMSKRTSVADAQLSKAMWTIVDQLRTQGILQTPSMDDLVAAAVLEQIAIIIESPHPTTQRWFNFESPDRDYVQTADPEIALLMRANWLSESATPQSNSGSWEGEAQEDRRMLPSNDTSGEE